MQAARGERGTTNGAGRAVLSALVAGAAGSLGLTLYAGLRIGSPPVLLVLFGAWVVFPFVILSVGRLLSRRGSAFAMSVYGGAAAAASGLSVAAYAWAALRPGRPPTAMFVLVAPLSLLLVAVVVPVLIVAGRKRRA
jgi:hypothetical protein